MSGPTFSVGFQNIHGMHHVSGCKLREVGNELTHDIEILGETWGCKCELEFENYFYESVQPQKHIGVKKGRDSGGFIVLFKNYLEKNVKIVKKSNNFIWIEVNRKFIDNLEKKFLICLLYS